jgi:hypothetical protein
MLLRSSKNVVAGKRRKNPFTLLISSGRESLLEVQLLSVSYRIYDNAEEKFTAKL